MTALLGLKISPTGPASNMKECQVSGGPYTETWAWMRLRSCFSQFETELRSEQQMDGMAKAKERGVRFGQQKRLTAQQVAELQARRKEGELIRELMADDGISKATVYGYLNQEFNSAKNPKSA